MAMGAVLTQAVAWRNVEMALARLKAHGLWEPEAIVEAPPGLLEASLRPTRYFSSKAQRLRGLAQLVLAYGRPGRQGLARLLALSAPSLRQALLSVRGIGPETADDILLYGAGHPVFVVDRYTHRIFLRIGFWPDPRYRYHAIQRAVERALPPDVVQYQEFHALLVRLGKEVCRPTPRCGMCPLADGCRHAAGEAAGRRGGV
ncbi:MAG: endonuclease [Firmicutes bacterium]|nr:endonuclease [Alicyclobacillaceae bacterium]MCL6496472.1 endonuclease [Bacillota bacterium]